MARETSDLIAGVGTRLAVTRKEIGLSQTDMAKEIGVSLRAYHSYERSDRGLPIVALVAIHDKFGTDVNWILLGTRSARVEHDINALKEFETSRQSLCCDELLKTGVRGKGGNMIRFAELEVIPGTKFLHASGSVADTDERVAVSFGPEHATIEQRQVEEAMNEAYKLMPKPKFLLFCAFTFDPEAAKDIDEMKVPGMTSLKVRMNTDLLTENLKKKRANNVSFRLMGQPEVDMRKRGDRMWEIEIHGFDHFNPETGEIGGGGKSRSPRGRSITTTIGGP